jgi:large subunit ribosomal protein L7/L12
MSVSQAQVVQYIKDLKLSEVKALIELLEDELGVSASAPVAIAAGPANAVEEQEIKTEFDVILKSYGSKKINVIKVVRVITNAGLKEAKALVEGVPTEIKTGISKEDADAIAKQLKECGSDGVDVEIK